jgi:hypothetical protein
MNKSLIEQILEDLNFDKNNLDEVWREQPRLLMQYGYKLAEAERSMADAKRKLDVTEARIYREARSKLGFDGVRISESTLDSRVKSDPPTSPLALSMTTASIRWMFISRLYQRFLTAET